VAGAAAADDADNVAGRCWVEDDAVGLVKVEAGVAGDDAAKRLGDEPLEGGEEMSVGHGE